MLKALSIINSEFPNSDEQKMLASLGAVKNWGKGWIEPGAVFQEGEHALVIALDGKTGKRCIKVMAKLPAGMKLTETGLLAIRKAWLDGKIIASAALHKSLSSLSEDRARAVVFAAVLEGDVQEIDFSSYDVRVP